MLKLCPMGHYTFAHGPVCSCITSVPWDITYGRALPHGPSSHLSLGPAAMDHGTLHMLKLHPRATTHCPWSCLFLHCICPMGMFQRTMGHFKCSSSNTWTTMQCPWFCLFLQHICPMGVFSCI